MKRKGKLYLLILTPMRHPSQARLLPILFSLYQLKKDLFWDEQVVWRLERSLVK